MNVSKIISNPLRLYMLQNGNNIMHTSILQSSLRSISTSTTAVENVRYFYNADHLGSTSFVSDASGVPVQYLSYDPFGRVTNNQKATGSSYNTDWQFSGKFFDAESRYSYFGARYYNSDIGIWLSVDPLAHKYPSLSPYVYCGNNPINMIDPDGKDIVPTNGGGNDAIVNYINRFDTKTQVKAFGYVETSRPDNKRGNYPVYTSSHKSLASSKEEFTKNLGKAGKSMSTSEINEAYSFYQALTSDKDYQVEVIHPGSEDSRGIQMQGSDFVEFVPGYSPRYSDTNNLLIKDLKEGNFDKIFNSSRYSDSNNKFGDGFNFYKNYVQNPYDFNDKKTAGVVMIDGRNPKDLGKIFKAIFE